MTINTESIETIDMGEFSLDLDQGKNQSNQGKELENRFNKLGSKPPKDNFFVKQAMKETTKISKRKTDEEIKEHQEFVLILSRYGQSKRFQEHLKMMGFNLSVTHLKKCEIEELKEIHQRIKVSIDNKSVSNFWEDTTFGALQTGEAIVVNTKLGQKVKIQGLTELLRNDETFLDLLEQIQLENQQITHTSPYVRLVYAIVSSAMKVHSVNSMLEKRLSIIQQSQETEEVKENTEMKEESQESENKAQETTQESKEKKEEPKEEQVLSFE